MARSRNIKPSLFKNELLGEADPYLTILFSGLWCLADREGRLEDRPKRIKAEIFPYRDGIDCDDMLDWLHQNGFINRYQVGDDLYIQVCNFHIHQNPHHMESESLIPPPAGQVNKFNAKPLYKKQKERILSRDGYKCVSCGSDKKLHIDHIFPVALGGTSDDSNLQVLCQSCNTSKGKKIIDKSLTNDGRIVESDSILLIPDSFKRIPDSCSSPAAKKKATQIDPDYKFNDQHRSLARSLGVSADVELGAFTDYHKSKGSLFKDWDAAFRTWLRNAAKFNAWKSPPQPQQTTAAHRPYTEPIRDKEQEKLDAKKAMQRLEQLTRLKNGQQANDRAKP